MDSKKSKAEIRTIIKNKIPKEINEHSVHLEKSIRNESKKLSKSILYIKSTDKLVSEYAEKNSSLPSEFQWLQDNFYLAERAGKLTLTTLKEIRKLPVLSNGYSRLHEFTNIFVTGTCCDINEDSVSEFLDLLQQETILEEKELNYFVPYVTFSMITYLKGLCKLINEKINGKDTGDFSDKMENVFSSLRFISTYDPSAILLSANRIERILAEDPSGIYPSMNEETRLDYRYELSSIAKKKHISEFEAAECVLQLSKKENCHIGKYIFDNPLGKEKKKKTGKLYFYAICFISILITLLLAVVYKNMFSFLILIIPISQLVKNLVDYIVLSKIKPRKLHRLDLSGGLPEEGKTLCVITSLITSENSIKELSDSLEKYKITNRDSGKNLLFGILADLPEAKEEQTPLDKKLIDEAAAVIKKLNEKYTDSFYFFIRRRKYNHSHRTYMGWERKRGAIHSLIEYLKIGSNDFLKICGNTNKLKSTKYIISLDSDTNLCAGSALELVSAAMHPHNKAFVDKNTKTVTKGYGILQPRISTVLEAANISDFTRIFAGEGGLDPYDSTSSDIFQDLCGEGNYNGKGLIDVDVYYECLNNRFPENTILSHDLLEGCYLRCGYAGDVKFSDGFPYKVLSYYSRESRWIRGDWQLLPWLFKKVKTAAGREKNPINTLSKLKIFENLRRSVVPIALLTSSIVGLTAERWVILALISFLTIFSGLLISSLELVFSKTVQGAKYHSKIISGFKLWLIQAFLKASFLPYEAYCCIRAVITALYRMMISRRNMLQWVTSSESDKKEYSGIFHYYKKMWFNILCGGILIILSANIIGVIVGIIWALAPYLAKILSEKKKRENAIIETDREYLITCSVEIWRYFLDHLTKKENFLPPDNWQEKPAVGTAHRTSPTNIGFALLSAISAYDLGIETKERTLEIIGNILNTVEKLPKWNGHLYNWYDTKTLEILNPPYISTVDSGNLYCSLITLNAFLEEYGEPILLEKSENLINSMDFCPLFDKKKNLFYIGWDIVKNNPSSSWYDLLSSEARLTSYAAVAKGMVSKKHWQRLSRALAAQNGYKGMVSWTGTMFEYLMPDILLPRYNNSLLSETAKFCLYSQKLRTKKESLPWGISESAFYAFDPSFNYRYKAHGVQTLALKRNMNTECVVSPYSSFLSLSIDPNGAIKNLKRIEKLTGKGKYGFYEAVDFTKSRNSDTGESKNTVKTFMVHHLGMSIAAINNAINENILQKRFFKDKEMHAFADLLKEKIPIGAVTLSKPPKDAPEKPMRFSAELWKNELSDTDMFNPRTVLMSNGRYTVLMAETGITSSSTENIQLTRTSFRPDARKKGMDFYLKSCDNTVSILPNCENKSIAVLGGTESSISVNHQNLKSTVTVSVPQFETGELRKIEIENLGDKVFHGEIICVFEPVLDNSKDFEAHPAFNKLLFEFTEKDDMLIVKRRSRGNTAERYLCVASNKEARFEISESKVFTRSEKIKNTINFDRRFDKTPSYDAYVCISIPITVEKNSKAAVKISLAFSLDESESVLAAGRILNDSISENASLLDRSAALLKMKSTDITDSFCLLSKTLYGDSFECSNIEGPFSQKDLWIYGISGDYPIITAETIENTDTDKVKNLIRNYIFLIKNGFSADLCIVINDGGDYYSPVNRDLIEYIRLLGGEKLINNRIGIHIIDSYKHDTKPLLSLSDVIVNLNDLFSYKRDTRSKAVKKEQIEAVLLQPKFSFNDEGTFTFNCAGKLPQKSWSNFLSNGRMGYIATDAGTGHMWFDNAREKKVSKWLNDSFTTTGSETIDIVIDEKPYSLFGDEDGFLTKVSFSPGKAVWERKILDVETSVTAFISHTHNVRVLIIKTTGYGNKIEYKTDLVLGSNNEGKKRVKTAYSDGVIKAESQEMDPFYILSSRKPNEFTTELNSWTKRELLGETGVMTNPCAGMVFDNETDLVIISGFEDVETLKKFCDRDYLKEELCLTEKFWENTVRPITINSPSKALNNYINHWGLYQVIACRIMGRSSIYQSGGAYGFRDQLQDACAAIWSSPKFTADIIRKASEHQYEEGDVQHWWHEDGSGKAHKGVRTRYSDDLLWLPYTLCIYTEKTGDLSICDEITGYIASPILNENEHERYEHPNISKNSADIFTHAVKACECVLERGTGKNGLLFFGGGDWNDGMNLVGIKGKGESVWLTWFCAVVLNKMESLCKKLNRQEKAEYYRINAEKLSKAADKAWNGEWYIRGYYDSGAPLGTIGADECAIDSISQSFSVFGNGSIPKIDKALKNAYSILFDKENRVVKLFTPSFDDGNQTPGYVKSYAPGFRENGGQYTHAAIWLARAMLEAGMENEGFEILETLLPENHDNDVYLTEPFIIPADVYTAKEHYGMGGWSWYTGAAGWYYRTAIESLLGIDTVDGNLIINPNLPEKWNGYKASIRIGDLQKEIIVSRSEDGYAIAVNGEKFVNNNLISKRTKI